MKTENTIEIDKRLIRQNSINLLREIQSVLDKNSINFWIDQGTLLGAIRDNDFIPWDWDIDLSAWKSQFNGNTSVWDDLSNAGFYIFHLKKSQHIRLEKKNTTIGDRHVDIHLFDKKQDVAISYFYTFNKNIGERFLLIIIDYFSKVYEMKNGPTLSMKVISHKILEIQGYKGTISISKDDSSFFSFSSYIRKIFGSLFSNDIIIAVKNYFYQIRLNLYGVMLKVRIPYRYFSNFEERKLLDSYYMIPEDVIGYLEYRYGENWKIPKKEYDFIQEDGSLKHENI